MDLNIFVDFKVLAVLALFLGAISIFLSWDDVCWYVYGRIAFKTWTKKREDQHRELVNAGNSAVAANILMVNKIYDEYLKSFESPEKGNWHSKKMRAMDNWLKQKYDYLLQFSTDQSVSNDDRLLAVEALTNYMDKHVDAISGVLKNA